MLHPSDIWMPASSTDLISSHIDTVTDLINALPGNNYVNTVQHAIIDEDVFSMSSAPSNSRNGVLCNQLLGYATVLTMELFSVWRSYIMRFPVFTSRLLATDLNTETCTSNHYETFLLFRLKPVWNLGTKNSSGFTPPAYEVTHTALELIVSLPRLKSKSHCDWRSVSQSVLVSSPQLGLMTVTALLLWGALSDERTGLSFVRVIVCSSKSFVIM
jgi:hypothetical protein